MLNRIWLKALLLLELITVSSFAAAQSEIKAGSWSSDFQPHVEYPFVQLRKQVEISPETAELWIRMHISVRLFGTEGFSELTDHYAIKSVEKLGTDHYKINLTVINILETHYSADDIEVKIEDRYCGLTDWKVGVPMQITGLDCSDRWDAYIIPTAGTPQVFEFKTSDADWNGLKVIPNPDDESVEEVGPEFHDLKKIVEGWE